MVCQQHLEISQIPAVACLRPDQLRPLNGHPTYEFVRHIDAGSYGFVQAAKHRGSGRMRGHRITRLTEREVCNHAHLQHPHIIAFRAVFLTDQYLCIVQELAEGGNMLQLMNEHKGLTEDNARWFFQQVILALDYSHRRGVVIRDVKLENTLLDSSPRPLVKLCDFGFTKSREDGPPATKLGTLTYTAPEILSSGAHNQQYNGEMADVWSVGIMLYTTLFYKYPFDPEEEGENMSCHALRHILQAQYDLPDTTARGSPVSPECKDLLRCILVADPAKRLTIAHIQQHPWYQQNLPRSLDSFNDEWIKRQEGKSGVNMGTIRSIVRQAHHVHCGKLRSTSDNLLRNEMLKCRNYGNYAKPTRLKVCRPATGKNC